MKGVNFTPPSFGDLLPGIGLSVGPSMDRGFTEPNRGMVFGMVEKVKGFHRIFGHPIGMIRWGQKEGPPGGLTKSRIQLRTKIIKEGLEELRNASWNGNWEEIMDGIGDLEYVILGTVVELGVSVDVVLNPDMIEGTLTLDLRSITKEVRQ